MPMVSQSEKENFVCEINIKISTDNQLTTVEPCCFELGYLEQLLEQIPISPRFPIGLIIVIPGPDISNSRYVEQILISRASSR